MAELFLGGARLHGTPLGRGKKDVPQRVLGYHKSRWLGEKISLIYFSLEAESTEAKSVISQLGVFSIGPLSSMKRRRCLHTYPLALITAL